MPLVIVCGVAFSGKTRFAEELKRQAEPHFRNIILINDESLSIQKQTTVPSIPVEKKNRAAFLAAVERAVSPDCLVIADAGNEIKGFRYQLYCVARACSTPHCCVHILASEEDLLQRARNVNAVEVLKDSQCRFEEPSGEARWDAPLFHVPPNGVFNQYPELFAILSGKPQKQPSLATRKTDLPVDYVAALEEGCRQVIDKITQLCINGQQLTVKINGHQVSFSKKPTILQLQKLKRQFIQMNRQTGCPVDSIEPLFIDYLNKYQE